MSFGIAFLTQGTPFGCLDTEQVPRLVAETATSMFGVTLVAPSCHSGSSGITLDWWLSRKKCIRPFDKKGRFIFPSSSPSDRSAGTLEKIEHNPDLGSESLNVAPAQYAGDCKKSASCSSHTTMHEKQVHVLESLSSSAGYLVTH